MYAMTKAKEAEINEECELRFEYSEYLAYRSDIHGLDIEWGTEMLKFDEWAKERGQCTQ